MITVTTDWQKLDEAMKPFSEDWVGFDTESLVSKEGNILLTDGTDNYAMFEVSSSEGVVKGHYLFGSARGREAVNLSKRFLSKLFNDYPAINVVIGRTPTYQKGALWLNKQLGFTSIGSEEINDKTYEIVALTREGFQT